MGRAIKFLLLSINLFYGCGGIKPVKMKVHEQRIIDSGLTNGCHFFGGSGCARRDKVRKRQSASLTFEGRNAIENEVDSGRLEPSVGTPTLTCWISSGKICGREQANSHNSIPFNTSALASLAILPFSFTTNSVSSSMCCSNKFLNRKNI